MNIINIAMLSCKEATALVEKKEGGAIGISDSLKLRLHLTMCKACQSYAKQSRLISEFIRSGFNQNEIPDEVEEELKKKIISRLK